MSLRTIIIALVAITAISLVGAAAGLGNIIPSEQASPQDAGQLASVATPASGVGLTPVASATPVANATPDAGSDVTSTDIVTDHQAFILLNPATVRPGSSVGVTGSGFDPGAQVEFTLKRKKEDKGQPIGFVQADKGGNFGGFSFNLPDTFTNGNFLLVARQHDGRHETSAIGHLTANSPVVTFGTQVGKPGDSIAFSMKGFAPREQVNVYWNSLGSRPVATLQMDDGGGLLSGSIPVPFGAVGNNSFVFMGDKSQSPVTVNFLMLNLYPTASVSAYAAKPDYALTFSGTGFGPKERVRVYLNSVQAAPVAIIDADDTGAFTNAGGFVIPFELKGKNSFIFLGEQSQAPATVSFDVLPYTPYAEASTYGGRPGTTITFYGQGFARQEVVHIFVGRGQSSNGQEVTCAKADNLGSLVSGGSYTIPYDARAGKLTFTLVGAKSKAEAAATMEVMDAGGPVPAPANAQPQGPFQCPYRDDEPATGPAPLAASQSTTLQTGQPAQTTPAAQSTAQPAAKPQQGATPSASIGVQATPQQYAAPTGSPQATASPQATVTAKPQPTETPKPQPTATPAPTSPPKPSPTTSGGR